MDLVGLESQRKDIAKSQGIIAKIEEFIFKIFIYFLSVLGLPALLKNEDSIQLLALFNLR
jgi:hypothetical protein